MDLRSSTFLILDCQTTGMRPSVGSLLEFCWAWASASAGASGVLEVHGGLVKLSEGEEIPARVREITGIRDSDLAGAVKAESIRAEFLKSVEEKARETGRRPVALIHYAPFEEAWLRDLLATDDLPFDILCTHRISKKLLPTVPSRNIRALTGYFGMRFSEIKRAAQHVRATHQIWRALAPILAENGIASFEELAAYVATAPKKSRAASGDPATAAAVAGARGAGARGAGARAAGYEYRVDREKRLSLPEKPGIYKMIAKSGEILYVGKATSLKDRVNSYFRGKKGRDPRKLEMMAQVWDLEVIECESAVEAALVESDEIKRLNPPYNVSLKEGSRTLVYYDRSLVSESSVHSASYPVGPFRQFNAVEHLRFFADGLREDVIRNVFFQPIESDVMEAGYSGFEERYPEFSPETMSVRDHLAFGLRLLRAGARGDEIADGVADEIDDETELTADDVVEKIERLYLRAAETYVRSRAMTRLLWSDVRWIEKGEEKTLCVRGGRLRGRDASLRPPSREALWHGLAIPDYDRMSVLLMEISKLEHEISRVR